MLAPPPDSYVVAGTQNEPYAFTHLIVVSRTYHLTLDEETTLSQAKPPPSTKRSKKPKKASHAASSGRPEDGIYSFHPEDEYIKQVSGGWHHACSSAFNSYLPGIHVLGRLHVQYGRTAR